METHTHWWGTQFFPEDESDQALLEQLYIATGAKAESCYEDGEITMDYNSDNIHLDCMEIRR